MAEVRLSADARADLVEIRIHSIEHFGDDRAAAYLRGIDRALQLLGAHPGMGRLRPELGDGLRSFIHQRHRIYYEPSGSDLLILRIVHDARNERNIFGALND